MQSEPEEPVPVDRLSPSAQAPATPLVLVRWNTAALAVLRVGSVLLDGVVYVITARYFGPQDYGHYISILAFLNLIDAAADMTILDITAREMSREPAVAGKWLVVSTISRIFLAVLGLMAYAVYLNVAGVGANVPGSGWIGALLLLASSLRMPMALLQATLKLHYELVMVLATRIINVLLFVALIAAARPVHEFFLGTFVSRMLLAATCWFVVLSRLRPHLEFAWDSLKRLVRECIPMGISGSFVAVQLKADILMMGSLVSPASAGMYAVVAQLVEYSFYVPLIITTPMFPVLSQAFAQDARDRFQDLYQRMINSIITVLIPIAVIGMLRSHDSVMLLFGERYAESATVVPWLVLSAAAMWISHGIAIATIALGLQSHFIWIQSICIAAYLVLDWLMIPRWTFAGAGAVRLLTTVIPPILTYYVVRRQTGFKLAVADLRPALVAGVVMAAVLWLCGGLPVAGAAAVASLVYIALLWRSMRVRAGETNA